MFGRNNRNRINNGYGGGYDNQGGFGGNFGGMRGGFGRTAAGGTAILALLIFGFFCYLGIKDQHKPSSVGEAKNALVKTPNEQKAAINAGLTQAQQAEKNNANGNLSENGDKDADKNIVKDQVLLTDQFDNLDDMYNFGKVYSMYVFANEDDVDQDWTKSIKEARDKGMKVVTYNGNQAPANDKTFIYNYFNKNYTVKKSNKDYGQPDGVTHPFMVLFINGTPQKLIVKPSQQKTLFDIQLKAKEEADKNADSISLPDQPVGLKNPDWGKALQYAKDKLSGKKISTSQSNSKQENNQSSSQQKQESTQTNNTENNSGNPYANDYNAKYGF